MPVFEYKCTKCGLKKEVFQKTDTPPKCDCGGLMKRIMSIFKFNI
mgnify:CR=1 FL=1